MFRSREVLRESLRFYARHKAGLLATSGLLLLPAAAVKTLAGPLASSPLVPGSLRGDWTASAGSAVLAAAQFIVFMVTGGMVTFFVARQLGGTPVDYRTAWRLGLARARPVLTAGLAVMLPAVGYLILFSLPLAIIGFVWADDPVKASMVRRSATSLTVAAALVFLSVRLAFVSCAAVIERAGGLHAYRRNLVLLAGRFARVAGVVVPIEVARQLVVAIATHALPMTWLATAPALGESIEQVVSWPFLPLEAVATTILYFRIRSETDGYDTARLASDVDQ